MTKPPIILTPKKLGFKDLVDLVRVLLCWITGFIALACIPELLIRFIDWAGRGFVPYISHGNEAYFANKTFSLSLLASITLGISWSVSRDKLKWPLILAILATIQAVGFSVLLKGGGINLDCTVNDNCFSLGLAGHNSLTEEELHRHEP